MCYPNNQCRKNSFATESLVQTVLGLCNARLIHVDCITATVYPSKALEPEHVGHTQGGSCSLRPDSHTNGILTPNQPHYSNEFQSMTCGKVSVSSLLILNLYLCLKITIYCFVVMWLIDKESEFIINPNDFALKNVGSNLGVAFNCYVFITVTVGTVDNKW